MALGLRCAPASAPARGKDGRGKGFDLSIDRGTIGRRAARRSGIAVITNHAEVSSTQKITISECICS